MNSQPMSSKANPYRPIACALHSEYERLAMRRARVRVQWRDNDAPAKECVGTVVDVRTRCGEEFLVLRLEQKEVEIRLDRIEAVGTL